MNLEGLQRNLAESLGDLRRNNDELEIMLNRLYNEPSPINGETENKPSSSGIMEELGRLAYQIQCEINRGSDLRARLSSYIYQPELGMAEVAKVHYQH